MCHKFVSHCHRTVHFFGLIYFGDRKKTSVFRLSRLTFKLFPFDICSEYHFHKTIKKKKKENCALFEMGCASWHTVLPVSSVSVCAVLTIYQSRLNEGLTHRPHTYTVFGICLVSVRSGDFHVMSMCINIFSPVKLQRSQA